MLRVFTDSDGNFGNPLGVINASKVEHRDRQQLAAQSGYSETIFVDLPSPGSTTAHATIHTPRTEIPFAGHPTVGASWWLRERGTPINTLQVPAGIVQVSYHGDLTAISARSEWAPDPPNSPGGVTAPAGQGPDLGSSPACGGQACGKPSAARSVSCGLIGCGAREAPQSRARNRPRKKTTGRPTRTVGRPPRQARATGPG